MKAIGRCGADSCGRRSPHHAPMLSFGSAETIATRCLRRIRCTASASSAYHQTNWRPPRAPGSAAVPWNECRARRTRLADGLVDLRRASGTEVRAGTAGVPSAFGVSRELRSRRRSTAARRGNPNRPDGRLNQTRLLNGRRRNWWRSGKERMRRRCYFAEDATPRLFDSCGRCLARCTGVTTGRSAITVALTIASALLRRATSWRPGGG